ncbi:Oidioi.mRNA.OKI2018_I69.PAR.g9097.t1.cds [Oikopleura dioica]|uniref:Oidioi.mRNA.OKI2018_I69.PAR.g9097.t1.cds n=1 Tax=Oikopleura dioica TaxID=34765 RepID=A0ABN7RPW6_OIKDI|nr:Oidioi.mRNA.OKI2018_I69.PAR.g9097.t1.cds [Oikopleura dioica]
MSEKIKLDAGNFGRGVFCESSIEENELLISVPINALLTTRKAQHVIESDKSVSQLKRFSLNGTDLLVVAIYLEFSKPDSKWRAFLESIPDELWNPFMLEDKELNLLTAKVRLPSKCLKQKLKVASNFLHQNKNEINKETLDWCFSVILSRSFSGSPERCKDEGGMKIEVENSADFVLCPAIDLINHHQDFNCEYRWNQQKTAFEIFAKTKIAKGHELFVNYGTSKTDFDLYNFYGFIPFSEDFQVELELARIKKTIYDDKNIDFLTSQLDMVFAMEKLESREYLITRTKSSADLDRLSKRIAQVTGESAYSVVFSILIDRHQKNEGSMLRVFHGKWYIIQWA